MTETHCRSLQETQLTRRRRPQSRANTGPSLHRARRRSSGVRSQSRIVNFRSAVDDFGPHRPALSLASEPFSVSTLIRRLRAGVKPKRRILWSSADCHPRIASLLWPSGGIRLVSQIADHTSTILPMCAAIPLPLIIPPDLASFVDSNSKTAADHFPDRAPPARSGHPLYPQGTDPLVHLDCSVAGRGAEKSTHCVHRDG